MMRRLRSPWVRAFLAWTAVLLTSAIVLAVVAMIGFLRSADACFFQTGPCAQAGDADFVRLQVAVFGIPLLWLLGVVFGAAVRALVRRRRTNAP